MSMYHMTTYALYKGLVSFALAQNTREKVGKAWPKSSLEYEKCAKHDPGNHFHKAMLLEADHAAIQGKVNRTIKSYDIAISHEKQHGYIQEEALAYERTAIFFNSLERSDKGRSSISPNMSILQIEMAAADNQLLYSEKEIT
eukprot:5936010-Ditylum_brightwellii.AAC.1